jgi:acyl-CoA dehydrogenase
MIWFCYALGLLGYLLPELRRRWLTLPLYRQFRRVMPAMSETERSALQAGNVWWDGDLFSGMPDWRRLLLQPPAEMTDREQAFLEGPVETLCRHLDDWRITHETRDLPPEIWQEIKRSGLFGMIIPQAYGGLELSALAHSNVIMKLASRSITAAVTVMVPNSLGPAKLLLRYGSEAQKRHYLGKLARGDEIPCFALTGPQAGSDAGAIPDRGELCYGEHDGRRILGIRLNWNKRYITLAPVATLIGLAFKLHDPKRLLGRRTELGITLALIPRQTPGVEIGERHLPLDIPFQNGPIRGRDVFIPLDWVIGGRNGIGQGWRMLMECLAEGRGISLPALAAGAGQFACRYTGAYAAVRRQFGLPIGRFEGVEEALARIAGLTYQMDATRRLTLVALDQGERPSVISAIVKYHLTERYRQLINDAMDIHGGSAICVGPNNLLARAYQSVPIAITVEGANILTRNMIIFGQGAIRCHPYLMQELEAALHPDPEQGLKAFDASLFPHLGHLVRNLARTLGLGLTRGRLSSTPGSNGTGHYFRSLNWLSAGFALNADLCLMTLGGALKRKERISARLGDLLSELYIASASLKRFIDEGEPTADRPLLDWALQDSLWRLQQAFFGLWRNLPLRPLACLLRWCTFPTGLPFQAPKDGLEHKVAGLLLAPNETRDRLTSQVYLGQGTGERMELLEQALAAVTVALPIERTLRQARGSGLLQAEDPQQQRQQALQLGLLNRQQLEILEQSERLRDRIIQVDAFADAGPRQARRDETEFPYGHLGAA